VVRGRPGPCRRVSGGRRVQESVAPQLLAKLRRRLATLRVGPALDKGVDMAAIHTPAQLDRIAKSAPRPPRSARQSAAARAVAERAARRGAHRYVELGRAEGGVVEQAGGAPEVAGCKSRCFFPPTLVTGVQTASRLAQVSRLPPPRRRSAQRPRAAASGPLTPRGGVAFVILAAQVDPCHARRISDPARGGGAGAPTCLMLAECFPHHTVVRRLGLRSEGPRGPRRVSPSS
jgi:hypothetical protein